MMGTGTPIPPPPMLEHAELPIRPAAPRLLAWVENVRPVRTRVPWLSLLTVALVACVYPLYAFQAFPLRRDLSALPPSWLVAVGLLWLAGVVVPLTTALLPPRGQVLPHEGRAATAAIVASVVLVAAGLFATVDAPGRTVLPPATWKGFAHFWWHCITFSARILLPVLLAGLLALRRFVSFGAIRLGAAVGVAGGALTGLTLHLLCPIGGGMHVGLAHGGAVVLGGALGAGSVLAWTRLASRQPLRP